MKFVIVKDISLFRKGINYSVVVRKPKSSHLLVFNSRDEANQWISENKFTEDPHDVIRSIVYKVRPLLPTD